MQKVTQAGKYARLTRGLNRSAIDRSRDETRGTQRHEKWKTTAQPLGRLAIDQPQVHVEPSDSLPTHHPPHNTFAIGHPANGAARADTPRCCRATTLISPRASARTNSGQRRWIRNHTSAIRKIVPLPRRNPTFFSTQRLTPRVRSLTQRRLDTRSVGKAPEGAQPPQITLTGSTQAS